jgi:hypothetical protein
VSAGLLDTSVVIAFDDPMVLAALPEEAAISTITMADLAAGPHLAGDSQERARRQTVLQRAEGLFDPIDFDREAARIYGQMVAAVAEAGRSHRRRVADLLIAAVAHANALPLYTRNPDDFHGLQALVEIVTV